MKQKEVEEAQAARNHAHRDQVVLAELARVDTAVKSRKPKTLGEARRLVGYVGWCGFFKGAKSPTATWSPRDAIPEGDSRIWPSGTETVWGEIARASVESCQDNAIVQWIEMSKPEIVTLPP